MSWLIWLLQASPLQGALTALLKIVLGSLGLYGGKILRKNRIKEDVIEGVSAAVSKTYDDFVRGAKAAASDGILTPDERKQARSMAVREAKEILKGPGLRMLKSWTDAQLESVVNKIVRDSKPKK